MFPVACQNPCLFMNCLNSAEARQKSGAEKLKGHDIMALERFDPEVKHTIVFDVFSVDSPVGDKGDKMCLFLTDAGNLCFCFFYLFFDKEKSKRRASSVR